MDAAGLAFSVVAAFSVLLRVCNGGASLLQGFCEGLFCGGCGWGDGGWGEGGGGEDAGILRCFFSVLG